MTRSDDRDATDVATEAIDTIRQARDEVAARGAASLSEGLHAAEVGVREYAGTISSQLADMAEQVESMSVEDFLHAGRKLATEKPALFALAAVAVGFAASRLLSEDPPARPADRPDKQASETDA